MRTEDLKNFIEICSCGSLNKTAAKLNISQQGLSRSIRDLEESIGARLFVRSSRGVDLTNYGKEFLVHAKSVVSETEKLESFIEQNRENKKDCITIGLRISSNASPMSSAINNTVEDFGQLNKDVNILIHSASQDILLEELKSGECDLVQVIGPVDERKYDIYPIFKYRLCALAADEFNLSNNKNINISELKTLPVILPAQRNPLCEQILGVFKNAGIEPNIFNYEASAKTLAHLVHRGSGIAFMPENSASVVTDMYKNVKAYTLLPETQFCYSVVVNKKGRKNPALKSFITYLQENSEVNLIPDSI